MDGYGNREDIVDLYPRPASAGCVNYSNWSPSNPTSSLFGSTSGERLEHLVKSRPRKPKTRAPTRVSIISPSSSSSTFNVDAKVPNCLKGRVRTISAGLIAASDKIDDGLESFFSKPGIDVLENSSTAKTAKPTHITSTATIASTQKIQTPNCIPRNIKQTPLSSNANVDKLQEKSTTSSSKSPTKAIQKIIKSFEIRVNRESVK